MPINKGFMMIVVCRKFRKFAPNLEVYVHFMFTKNNS